MALLKQIDSPARNGSSAEYWRIGEIRVNTRVFTIEVVMHGYRDKEFAGEIRNNPAIDVPLVISGDDYARIIALADTPDKKGGGLRRAIYEHARAMECFADADDD